MFTNDIKLSGTGKIATTQTNLDVFYRWSAKWEYLSNLDNCQRLMENGDVRVSHMGQTWHQVKLEKTEQEA